jgi:cytochrome c biogenesis protein CcmG, thiol:disulfide interchange protein DsbE
MSAMSLRGAVRRTAVLARAHKVITGSIVVFVAAFITISLTTGSSSAPKTYPVAAPFSVAALDGSGGKVSLSQYPGKPVIINFWASWCGPCQQETPLLASWYKQQHGKVVLLGIDENDSLASARTFASASGISYPVGFDPTMVVAAGAYGLNALPQTFFLNAQHRIVDQIAGAVTTAELAEGLRLMDTVTS